jgi:hypothetical protein
MGCRLIHCCLALAAAGSCVAAACSRDALGIGETLPDVHGADPPVLFASAHSGIDDPVRTVIRQPTDWARFWSELRSDATGLDSVPPAVDFATSAVVVASASSSSNSKPLVRDSEQR